jgi:hydrogenase expression/formation protein HypC
MCLAIPAKILSIDEQTDRAVVTVEGVKKEISLALVEAVKVNDFVLVHVGYALSTISPQEARKTLALMAQAGLVAADRGDDAEGDLI